MKISRIFSSLLLIMLIVNFAYCMIVLLFWS